MQRYFSHICDSTDVPTVGPHNAIDISQGSLTCPSCTDTGPTFLYGDSDTPPHLIAFYEHTGDTEDVKPPAPFMGEEIGRTRTLAEVNE